LPDPPAPPARPPCRGARHFRHPSRPAGVVTALCSSACGWPGGWGFHRELPEGKTRGRAGPRQVPRLGTAAGTERCGIARVRLRARIKPDAVQTGGACLKESLAGLGAKRSFDSPVAEVAWLIFRLCCQGYLFCRICSLLAARVCAQKMCLQCFPSPWS